MNPFDANAPAPSGYERIECRHAHEIEKWSKRLAAQEKRFREMTDEERDTFEEGVWKHMMSTLRDNLLKADPKNRMFLEQSIKRLEERHQRNRLRRMEADAVSYMHCESKEGVAS